MNKTLKLFIPAVMAFSLIACGGGSGGGSPAKAPTYSGKTTAASFTNLKSEQTSELGETSSEVVTSAFNINKNSSDLGGYVPFSLAESSGNNSKLEDNAENWVKNKLPQLLNNSSLTNLPTAIKESGSEKCDISGSVSGSINFNEKTGNGSFSLTFKKCVDEEGELENGKISAKITSNSKNTTLAITFTNYSYSYEDQYDKYSSRISGVYEITTARLNFDESDYWDDAFEDMDDGAFEATWNLVGNIDGENITSVGGAKCDNNGKCTFTSDIKAKDGKVYRTKDIEFNDDDASGIIYHPDYGYYTFEATVYSWCDEDDKSPFVGEATYTDENGNSINYSSTACDLAPTIH